MVDMIIDVLIIGMGFVGLVMVVLLLIYGIENMVINCYCWLVNILCVYIIN